MKLIRVTLCTVALLIAAAGTAPAQDATAPRRTPDGTWLSAGIGGGWTRLTCSICRLDRNLGPSGYFRVGTTLRPGLLLAAEIDGWTREEGSDRATVGAGGIATYIYPDPAGGLFLKGGAAYVRYSVGDGNNANLFGLLVGAGYDFPVAAGLNVTNYVNLVASSFGSLRSDRGTVANDVSVSLLQFGIGLTRH